MAKKNLNILKEKLISDYEELKSFEKIGKLYGLGRGTIKYYFIKYNIPYKTKIRQYNVNHNYFSEETEESFYWAGFLAADGCISIRKKFNFLHLTSLVLYSLVFDIPC